MNYGAGWVVLQESHSDAAARSVVSILSPRRSQNDVAAYVQQRYVDCYGSIEERLEFKKSRRSTPFHVHVDRIRGLIDIGHDPHFIAFYCNKILLENAVLTFHYRIMISSADAHAPEFADRKQSISIATQ